MSAPIHHWTLDNNDLAVDGVATDIGTDIGTAAAPGGGTNLQLNGDAEWLSDGGVVLNGTSAYLKPVGDELAFAIPNGFTWCAWVRFDTQKEDSGYLLYLLNGDINRRILLRTDNGKTTRNVNFYMEHGGSNINFLSADDDPATADNGFFHLEGWTHIAVTVSSGKMTLWRDGATDPNGAWTADGLEVDTRNITYAYAVLGRHGGGGCFFAGAFRDVRIYDRALSSAELAAVAWYPVRDSIELGFWQQKQGGVIEKDTNHYIGHSVSLSTDGLTLALGSPATGTFARRYYSGGVQIFKFSNKLQDWGPGVTKEGPSEGGGGFGCSVSLSADGKFIVIGSPSPSESYPNGFSLVYRFDEDKNAWEQFGQVIEDVTEDPGNNAQNGHSVSILHNENTVTVAVGSYKSSAPGTRSKPDTDRGRVIVYTAPSTTAASTWASAIFKPRGTPIRGAGIYRQLGYTVSISNNGDTLGIGTVRPRGSNENGYVKVYDWDVSDWSESTIIKLEGGWEQHAAGNTGAMTGNSISFSSDGLIIAIGSPLKMLSDGVEAYAANEAVHAGEPELNINDVVGQVEVHERSAVNNEWNKVDTMYGKRVNERFGFSVSLSDDGKTMCVGAPGTEMEATPGSVQIYKKNHGDKWVTDGDVSDYIYVSNNRLYRGADSPRPGDEAVVRDYTNVVDWNNLKGNVRREGYGYSVYLSGDGKAVAVGTRGKENYPGDGVGQVEVYRDKQDLFSISSITLSWGKILNAPDSNTDGTIKIITSGVENGRTISVELNSTTYVSTVLFNEAVVTIYSADLKTLENKIYKIIATAINVAETRTATKSLTFTVDTRTVINGEILVVHQAGTPYIDEGAIVWDAVDGETNVTTTYSNGFDISNPGIADYTVTYTYEDTPGHVVATATATRTVQVVDIVPPVITIKGENPVDHQGGTTYTDAGASALDAVDGETNVTTTYSNGFDISNPGVDDYTVTYKATDTHGNVATATRTVQVVDIMPPVITIKGENPVDHQTGTTYTDAGASALDAVDGETNVTTTYSNGFDISNPGVDDYTVTYKATDTHGNVATATRTVQVVDIVPPVITIKGENPVDHQTGTTYTDAGASALDAVDGETNVTTTYSNGFDISNPGVDDYTVTYKATDTYGNVATATRTVQVVDGPSVIWKRLGGNKITDSAKYFSGTSVSLSKDGSIMAVGSSAMDTEPPNSPPSRASARHASNIGRVRIYKLSKGAALPLPGARGADWELMSGGTLYGGGREPNEAGSGGHWESNNWTDDRDWRNPERFGRSIALSEDGLFIVIGAPRSWDARLESGAYVYSWNDGDGWVQLGDKLVGNWMEDFPADLTYASLRLPDECGFSVDISHKNGNLTIIVGSPTHDNMDDRVLAVEEGHGGTRHGTPAFRDSGRAQVYKWIDETWVMSDRWKIPDVVVAKMTAYRPQLRVGGKDGLNIADWLKYGTGADGIGRYDNFGRTVTISSDGSTVAVGTPGGGSYGQPESRKNGYVIVYEYVDIDQDGKFEWKQKGTIFEHPYGEDAVLYPSSALIGSNISLNASGSIIAIGFPVAMRADGLGARGQVQVYKWDTNEPLRGVWASQGDAIYGERENEYCGFSVSLSSDGLTIAIGSPGGIHELALEDHGTKFYGFGAASSPDGTVRIYKWVLRDRMARIVEHQAVLDSGTTGAWEKDGEDLKSTEFPSGYGYSVSLSSDGTVIAVGTQVVDDDGERDYEVRGNVETYSDTDLVFSSSAFFWGAKNINNMTPINTNWIKQDGVVTIATSGIENDQLVTVSLNSHNYFARLNDNIASVTISSDIFANLLDGSYEIIITVSNEALTRTAMGLYNLSVDITPPRMTITAAGVNSGGTSNDATLSLTFTSNEATTDFTYDDITLTNGSLSGFAGKSDTVYTATFTPDGEREYTISVAASKFTDAAGNSNTVPAQFVWTHDITSPTMIITAVEVDSSGKTSNDATLSLTFTSNEATTDFTYDDITLTNGSLSGFDEKSDTVYTATFTPDGEREYTISVAASKFTDAAGNSNTVPAQFVWTHDITSPTMIITAVEVDSSGKTSNDATLSLTFTSNEATTDFTYDDITLTNGSLSGFDEKSDTVYTATFTPDGEREYTISVAASKFTDAAGNSNTVPAQFVWTHDITSPTMIITADEVNSGGTSNDATLLLTFTSSEQVPYFTYDDITLTNGSLSGFAEKSDTVYTATFTPDGEREYTISVAASKFTDAAGNVNTVPAQFVWTHDTTAPAAPIIKVQVHEPVVTPIQTGIAYVNDGATFSIDVLDAEPDSTVELWLVNPVGEDIIISPDGDAVGNLGSSSFNNLTHATLLNDADYAYAHRTSTGSYVVKVRSKDLATNSVFSEELTIFISNDAPEFTLEELAGTGDIIYTTDLATVEVKGTFAASTASSGSIVPLLACMKTLVSGATDYTPGSITMQELNNSSEAREGEVRVAGSELYVPFDFAEGSFSYAAATGDGASIDYPDGEYTLTFMLYDVAGSVATSTVTINQRSTPIQALSASASALFEGSGQGSAFIIGDKIGFNVTFDRELFYVYADADGNGIHDYGESSSIATISVQISNVVVGVAAFPFVVSPDLADVDPDSLDLRTLAGGAGTKTLLFFHTVQESSLLDNMTSISDELALTIQKDVDFGGIWDKWGNEVTINDSLNINMIPVSVKSVRPPAPVLETAVIYANDNKSFSVEGTIAHTGTVSLIAEYMKNGQTQVVVTDFVAMWDPEEPTSFFIFQNLKHDTLLIGEDVTEYKLMVKSTNTMGNLSDFSTVVQVYRRNTLPVLDTQYSVLFINQSTNNVIKGSVDGGATPVGEPFTPMEKFTAVLNHVDGATLTAAGAVIGSVDFLKIDETGNNNHYSFTEDSAEEALFLTQPPTWNGVDFNYTHLSFPNGGASDGTYILTFTLTDVAGNVGSVHTNLDIKTTAIVATKVTMDVGQDVTQFIIGDEIKFYVEFDRDVVGSLVSSPPTSMLLKVYDDTGNSQFQFTELDAPTVEANQLYFSYTVVEGQNVQLGKMLENTVFTNILDKWGNTTTTNDEITFDWPAAPVPIKAARPNITIEGSWGEWYNIKNWVEYVDSTSNVPYFTIMSDVNIAAISWTGVFPGYNINTHKFSVLEAPFGWGVFFKADALAATADEDVVTIEVTDIYGNTGTADYTFRKRLSYIEDITEIKIDGAHLLGDARGQRYHTQPGVLTFQYSEDAKLVENWHGDIVLTYGMTVINLEPEFHAAVTAVEYLPEVPTTYPLVWSEGGMYDGAWVPDTPVPGRAEQPEVVGSDAHFAVNIPDLPSDTTDEFKITISPKDEAGNEAAADYITKFKYDTNSRPTPTMVWPHADSGSYTMGALVFTNIESDAEVVVSVREAAGTEVVPTTSDLNMGWDDPEREYWKILTITSNNLIANETYTIILSESSSELFTAEFTYKPTLPTGDELLFSGVARKDGYPSNFNNLSEFTLTDVNNLFWKYAQIATSGGAARLEKLNENGVWIVQPGFKSSISYSSTSKKYTISWQDDDEPLPPLEQDKRYKLIINTVHNEVPDFSGHQFEAYLDLWRQAPSFSYIFTYDTTGPTMRITADEVDSSGKTSNDATLSLTFTSNEATTDFTYDDITLTNGSLSGFDEKSDTVYTATFTPDGEQEYTISVAASKFTDAVGNVNTVPAQFVWTHDITSPTMRITADEVDSSGKTSNDATLSLTFTSNEATTDFTYDDITLTNGSLSGFDEKSDTVYTATFTPDGEREYTISVAASKFTDAVGNVNTVPAQFVWTHDITSPTMRITADEVDSSGKTSNDATLSLTFTSNEATTDFTYDDITLTNGSLSGFDEKSDTVYTATFTPDGEREYTISVAASKFTDAAGNSNTVPAQFVWTHDITSPTMRITADEVDSSGKTSNDATLSLTFTSNEATTDFTYDDITLTNGSLSGFDEKSDTVYTATFTPDGEREYTISVAASKFTDAAGNSNTVPAQFVWTHDITSPTMTITAAGVNSGGTSNDATLLLTFISSEQVPYFPKDVITLTNGSLGDFFKNSDTVSTATFTAEADGKCTISVEADKFADKAGNVNTVPAQFVWTYDTTAPTMTITTAEVLSGKTSNDATLSLTFTSNEATTDFTYDDITLTNGSLSGFDEKSDTDTVYTAIFTPDGEQEYTISVAAGKFTDAVGNVNTVPAQFVWTYDTTAPTMTITTAEVDSSGKTSNDATLSLTFTSNEATTDFTYDDITLTNGSLSGFDEKSDTVYTATFTPDGEREYTISVAASKFTDAAGNSNTVPAQFVWTHDITSPTMRITADEVDSSGKTSNDATLSLTFTSNEATTDFTYDDITLTNGSLSGFDEKSDTVYTATFTPDGEREYTISVAASKFTDAAGNVNTVPAQFVWTYDTTAPTMTITTAEVLSGKTSNDATLSLTFTSNEATTDFTKDDITLTNGSLSGFDEKSDTVYTAIFTPDGEQEYTISVAASKFTDAAGNSNTVPAQFVWTYDTTAPTMTITTAEVDSSGKTSNDATLSLTFTSNEATTDFTYDDITLTNGSLSGFDEKSDTVYTATFTPDGEREYTISVAASKFTDAAGNSNTVPAQFVWTHDITSPTMRITADEVDSSGKTSNDATLSLTFTSNEATTDFTYDDITLTNGSLSGFDEKSDTVYTATFTPDGEREYTISVAASKFTDAAGNSNTVPAQFVWTHDITSPTMRITADEVDSSGKTSNDATLSLTFTSNEATTDFTKDDITLTNGSLSGFAGESDTDTVYTAIFTPDGEQEYTISVAAGKFTDAVGNVNTVPAQFVWTYDTTAPTMTITTAEVDSSGKTSNDATLSLTFTSNEATTDFTYDDITLTNGSLSGFDEKSDTVYTAIFTPDGEQEYTISVAASKFTDAAGNSNTVPAQFVWTHDITSPTMIITADEVDSGKTSNDATLSLTFTSNEATTDFTYDDITLTNGSLSGFDEKSDTVYTATFTPDGEREYTISVAADKFTDAAGNSNTATGEFTWEYTQLSRTAIYALADPYITPVYGPKYKLPDKHGLYRYISSRAPYNKRFTLDVDVLGLNKEQQREGLKTLVAKYKDILTKYNKKVTLEGFFFRNYLLTNKGEKLLIDTEDNTINNCPVENFKAAEDSLFIVKVGGEQTVTLGAEKDDALYTVSINTHHETYGDITIELYKFENPQWRNGIMMRTSKHITHENSKGLILGFQHTKNFTIKKLGSKKDILDFDTKKISNVKEVVEEFSYIERKGAEITTKKVINRFKQQR